VNQPDDHLPAPLEPEARPAKKAPGGPRSDQPARSAESAPWGDRILFAVIGLLAGFSVAYVYLEKVPGLPASAARDPHAGLGVGPGATRDLPGSGGGAPSISADPAVRQKIREMEEAVAKDPKNYDLLVKLGNAAYDAEDSRQAIDAYERALKIKGDDVNVLTDLGVSYRNLGDSDKALALFEKAVQIDPKHWPAVFNQVIVYGVDRGDIPRAKALLKTLKAAHPEIPTLDKLEAALDERAKGKA
jgi:hypothetical protein